MGEVRDIRTAWEKKHDDKNVRDKSVFSFITIVLTFTDVLSTENLIPHTTNKRWV
jgi:hypothetical protein